VWCGPERLLARVREAIVQLDAEVIEKPNELEMLACLKVETPL
jgi:hypothetical protein